MNLEAFVSALPSDQTIKSRSAEELEETMLSLGVNQETRQLGKGKFRSELAVRSTISAELYADQVRSSKSARCACLQVNG
jgi:hypothetical protein